MHVIICYFFLQFLVISWSYVWYVWSNVSSRKLHPSCLQMDGFLGNIGIFIRSNTQACVVTDNTPVKTELFYFRISKNKYGEARFAENGKLT